MKIKGLLALLSLLSIILFFSCTKINVATELGDDLIPAVDNVNTFDTTLEIDAAFFPFEDTSRHFIDENMALGRINDPAFGSTTADMYFNLSSAVYGTYPYITNTPSNPDSLKIDSVVLSLSYQASYGDTAMSTGSQISVQVSEIAPNNGFVDTMLYRFDHAGFSTIAPSLGSKTFTIKNVTDSQTIIRKRDTSKVARVLRIPLSNSIGQKLASYDTTSGPNGGYKSDTAFRKLFRGLTVKTISATGNGALAYFNLTNLNTRLIVYFRATKNGVTDTTFAQYLHTAYSQANSIKRTAGGEYLAKIQNQPTQPYPQKLYIQSSPTGSYIGMKIPGLDAFPNKVIHRAELIAYKVAADDPIADNILTVPNRLLLDHKGPNNSKDSVYIFDNDIQPGFDGSLNFDAFGGIIKTDDSYRFNITRYVQGIVTRKERNDSFRLFAPLRSNMYSKNLGQIISVPNLDFIAKGRVVIANNNFPDRTKRLRLRIIYSNL